MAGPNTRTKSNVDTAFYQAAQDYLKSDAFLKAIESAIEKGINKQLNKLIERIEGLEKSSATTIERVEKNESAIMDLDVKMKAKTKEIENLNNTIATQAQSLNNLKLEMNDLQQYSRRNCLKFYGVQENKEENTDEVICRLVSERLGVPLSTEDLDRSHRVAARLPQEGGAHTTDAEGASSRKKKPRAIIVKFCSYRKRSAVMHARRRLKGSGMGIDEALTAHNQDLLWKAKRHEKVKDAWTLDGRVTVLLAGTNGKSVKKVIRNKDELITLK